MIFPDFQEFAKLSRQGNWVPVWTTVAADLMTPVSAYLKLASVNKGTASRYSFLLESVEGGETIARYTYLGFDPASVVRFWMDGSRATAAPAGGRAEVSAAGHKQAMYGDFFSLSRDIITRFRLAPAAGLPPFTAGAVGYFGYDMVALREPVSLPHREPTASTGQAAMPDALLMFPSTVLVFDHVKHQIWIVRNVSCQENSKIAKLRQLYAQARQDIQRLEKELAGPLLALASKTRSSRRSPPVFRSNFTKRQFLDAVRRAKQHIQAGDIFQVVLSQRLETKLRAAPFDVYRALRRVNPAPYLFYLQMGSDAVLGSSPEMLVKVTGRDVEYRPIAGTRPRGADPGEDQRLEHELLADEKERAEHVMLVDLGRNDVGRVCRFGTVQVSDLMFVERYSHVMHLVSSIHGKLREGLDAWDALWACFPAGTVSGAPKVRAMQIISELEPTRRGLYAGSVLYFDLTGNLNSCIAIRSIVMRKGQATVQVGAGIVADSVPQREYDETMNKGKAMLKAIEMAEQEFSPGRHR